MDRGEKFAQASRPRQNLGDTLVPPSNNVCLLSRVLVTIVV